MKTEVLNDSWDFLRKFYASDNNIVNLINAALRVSTKSVSLRNDSEDSFMHGFFGLLSPNQDEHITYREFLEYVFPVNRQESVENIESSFITHLWVNLLSSSEAKQYFSATIRNNFEASAEYWPYIILLAMGIQEDWFIYGGKCQEFLVDDADNLDLLQKKLAKGYKDWSRSWGARLKWQNVKTTLSKHFRRITYLSELFGIGLPQRLSSIQLYPLAILLITLRREITAAASMDNRYLSLRASALYSRLSVADAHLSLLYGLYNAYEDADDDIKMRYEDHITPVSFHPAIAKLLLEYRRYKFLYEGIENDGLQGHEHQQRYIETEKQVKAPSDTRLLIDYAFPFTQIRKNDIFVPTSFLSDDIYLSLELGSSYHNVYRNPTEDERFDIIQIEPITQSEGKFIDNRTIAYRPHLKPDGNFLLVKTAEEGKVYVTLKKAFSDFRHDLKTIMSKTDIMNLQNKIDDNQKIISISNDIIKAISDLSPSEDMLELNIQEFRKTLAAAERKCPPKTSLLSTVSQLRDKVEDALYEGKVTDLFLSEIKNDVILFKQINVDIYENTMTSCKERLKDIEYSFDVVNSLIKIAGVEPSSINIKDEIIPIKEFLRQYVRNSQIRIGIGITITSDFDAIDDNQIIRWYKASLIVVLNSIIDNAINHGFEGYSDVRNPEIHFSLHPVGKYLLLKVCNNGRPMAITNEDYRTRGVFSGITGHTGIGGYQISKYAELQGGYVEIPTQKSWNTEIHLYIKL